MLKVNAEKALNKERKNSIGSDTLKEAQLLLEQNVAEERSLLKEAGLDFNLAEMEKEVGINLERQKLEKSMEGTIFTEEEIKGMCVKYRLRFLKSNRYKGKIDPVLGARLLRFFQEKKIDSKSYDASENLFIMAPAKAFNLDERPKPMPVDPVMFYRTKTKEGNMYSIVHKWGNDFTIGRRLLGIMYQCPRNLVLSQIAILGCLGPIIYALFGGDPFTSGPIVTGFCVAAALVSIFHLAYRSEERAKYRDIFTPSNWNSDLRN